MTRTASPTSCPAGALRSAAQGLGIFSLALGVAELLAPRTLARMTGMHGRETLIRAYGLREIVNGIGLLSSADPRPWLWGRVAGDALDLSTLALRTGQTHVNRWTDNLLRRIQDGQIDPSFVITHTVGLEDGPGMYETFRDKKDGCIKVVLKP